jgi:hypothetical protein
LVLSRCCNPPLHGEISKECFNLRFAHFE